MDPIDTYVLRVHRFQRGRWSREDRGFPKEIPVAIYVNASLLATISAMPAQLDALAVGFLFTEKIISSTDDVKSVSSNADDRRGQIWVDLTGEVKNLGTASMTSGCGRGITFLCPSELDGFEPVGPSGSFSTKTLRDGMKQMRERAEKYGDTGGSHAAACMCPDGSLTVAEDIGRHNAVDKAIGSMLNSGSHPGGCALLTTGRISSEMVLKAAVSGCPLVGSLTGATHMAAEISTKLNITLVTYVRGERMDVCTHPQRILDNGRSIQGGEADMSEVDGEDRT
ncbi:MAG: formate dehydrogenase accessory sulfurtransferase FdhD [Planctomycetota bacterium]|jgi:FdhD protein